MPPQGKKRESGQEEEIYYKNNRGSFWELENRIIGRKKRIICWGLTTGMVQLKICDHYSGLFV